MSQEKVARYKNEKANRKATMKKEKRARFMRNCVAGVVVAALVGWIGYSTVNMHENNKTRQIAEVDYSEIQSYLQGMAE